MTATMNDHLSDVALANSIDGTFSSRAADLRGVELHYVMDDDPVAGRETLLLIGGWPRTWWQWHKVMPDLNRRYRVIAVDLRGTGGSSKPLGGYDKKTMAQDVRELVDYLGLSKVHIAGHDIGAMVAYAYAANYPDATGKLCMLDVMHPDESLAGLTLMPGSDQHIDSVIEVGARPYLWWFAFNQVRGLPEQLLDGRSHLLIEWLIRRLTKDPRTIDEHSREVYARAYATADAIRAGNAGYQAFHTDIADERTYQPVTAPILGLGGDYSNYGLMRDVLPSKGNDVQVIEIADCGHYISEEQPQALVEALTSFLG